MVQHPPLLMRHGVCLRDLGEAQRAAALALVREMPKRQRLHHGAQRDEAERAHPRTHRPVRGIRRVVLLAEYFRHTLGGPALGLADRRPPPDHQLLALGDQIVLTPNFMGSEPVFAASGEYAGTRVFEEEEAKGFALMSALSPAQQRRRRSAPTCREVFAAAFRDNLTLDYQGIRYDRLTPDQQALAAGPDRRLCRAIRPGHAEIRLDEVKAHLARDLVRLDRWPRPDSPFYYRIHSPVILIEFDHQRGIALDNDEPSRNHIHTLVRTPNGNDYGKDLYGSIISSSITRIRIRLIGKDGCDLACCGDAPKMTMVAMKPVVRA